MDQNPITINLHEYPGQRIRVLQLHADYACANTGLCCEEPWGVPLMPPEARRLEEVFAGEGRADEFSKSVLPVINAAQTGIETGFRFAAGACGCVFHGREGDSAEGLSFCKLHKAHGHAVLPTICQSFPRLAVRTPAGIYLTLTNACPTAAKLLLKENALAESAPRTVFVGQHLGGSIFGDRAEAPKFSARCRPDWEAFDYFWRWAPEWMSNRALTPGEALLGLGLIVGHIESLGAAATKTATLIDQLDQVGSEFPQQLKSICAGIPFEPLLGPVYFETLLNISAQVHPLPAELAEIHAAGPAARDGLAADYAKLIRPRLAEFETIERNYIGSRLFANPLAYRASSLRAGYFIVVLSAVALRFTALALARREGTPLDSETLLRAAGMVDKLLLHNSMIGGKFAELIEKHINTEIQNLAQPALV